MKPLEETNEDTFRIFELARLPMLVAFVDLKSTKDREAYENSVYLVDNVLNELAKKYERGVIITYADTNVYNRHRKLLGLNHNK